MAVMDKQRRRTLTVMPQIWARKVLKQLTLERGYCGGLQGLDARISLQDY